MLTYLEIARSLRPRWIVWENVPGVLSSGRGRDLGAFLGALGELGYGWAYRVLDAQWVRTQRHPRAVPQRRRRIFVVGCLGDGERAAQVLFERESVCRDSAPSRATREGVAADAEAGTRAGCIHVAFRKSRRAQSVNDHETWLEAEQANTLNQFDTGERDTHAVAQAMTVRRLTPRECERLQGFPDDWTMIPWRKKPAEDCPDGPRYRALGNSMAVNVMAWIGERIAGVEARSAHNP